jgi:sterol desaturase/sphingolipid hydroxylase (fatty acid hydroxylase superfamily)
MINELWEGLGGAVAGYFASMTQAEIISISAIAGTAALFIFLERLLPYTRGQAVLREGFFDDLALYTIAQSYILGIVIFSVIIRALDDVTGLSRLRLLESWPLWLQLVFFTLTHDFYIYWMHRWQHRNKYLWRIHEAHHSPRTVDWLSGSRSHALEILINQTVEFTPIVLLGASADVVAYKGLISAVWGMYIHSNLDMHTGVFQHVINGPEMHRWHHSVGKGRNNNFATKLAIWDWMFGTAYLPGRQKPAEYGLKTWFPPHFVGQFIHAFRSFKHPSVKAGGTGQAPSPSMPSAIP